jgi:tetratricopeptide (TPR) repeat protein
MVRATAPQLGDDAIRHVDYCAASTAVAAAPGGPGPLPAAEQQALRDQAAATKAAYLDPAHQQVMAASTAAVQAMVRGDYEDALARAEDGLQVDPRDPWLLYNKGSSLAALGRVDDSLTVLRDAEGRFSSEDTHGRSVAAYGRALILESVGRCDEASTEYKHYVALAGDSDPNAQAHVRSHLRMCRLSASGRATF